MHRETLTRIIGPGPYDVTADWKRALKKTIARFARGNISAQNARILLKEEQEREHTRTRAISGKWKTRYKKPSAR